MLEKQPHEELKQRIQVLEKAELELKEVKERLQMSELNLL